MTQNTLLSRRVQTRQPQYPVDIDRSVASAFGLVGGVINHAPTSLVDLAGSPITAHGGSTFRPVVDAVESVYAIRYVKATNGCLSARTGSPNARSFTYSARLRVTGAGGTGVIARSGASRGTAGGNTIPIWRSSGGQYDMRIAGTDYTAAGTWADGQMVDIEIVGTATSCRLYVDGQLVINGGAAANSTIDPFCFIDDTVGGTGLTSATVDIVYAVWADKPWTDNQRNGWRENPFQVFRPRRRIAYYDVSGAVSLVIAQATHNHAADSLILSLQSLLSVADSAHDHVADNIVISTELLLAIAESAHAHTAENLTLDTSNATQLTSQDATHEHAADSIGLTLDTWLSVADASHTHSADNVTFVGDAPFTQEQLDYLLNYMQQNLNFRLKYWNGSSWV